MLKRDELSDPTSCMSKAADDEMVFVLRAKDPAAPVAIRAWIDERVRLGLNKPLDEKAIDAELCSRAMERQRIAMSQPADDRCQHCGQTNCLDCHQPGPGI